MPPQLILTAGCGHYLCCQDLIPYNYVILERLNPLGPHDASKHHLSPRQQINFLTTEEF